MVQSQLKFNKVPEKVLEKDWEALVQSQARPHRIPDEVPEKVWEALVQSRVRLQQASCEGSGEGLGGFGAKQGEASTGFL